MRFLDGKRADERAGLVRDLHGDDAFAAARLLAVFLERGALAEAVFRSDEKCVVLLDKGEADDVIALDRADAHDALGRAAERAGVLFGKAEADALVRDEDDLIVAGGEADADELVLLLKDDGNRAGLAVVAEFVDGGLLHLSGTGGEEDKARFLAEGDVVAVFIDRALEAEHGGDFFLRLEIEDILDAASDGGAGTFGELIDALDVEAAGVREKQQIVVGLDGEEVLHEIIFHILRGGLGLHALEAFSAAALKAVFGGGGALDIAAVREGDDHRVVGDEILHRDLADFRDDGAFTGSGVLRLDRLELVLDDGQHALLAGEDVEVIGDLDEDAVVFGLHLVALKAGELIEPELEDRIHLALGENVFLPLHRRLRAQQDAEALGGFRGEFVGGETGAGFIAVLGIADDLDEIIEVPEGEEERLKELGALLRFS